MSSVIQISVNGQEHSLGIKEYRRQRVITFKDIDVLHGRPDGTAGRNFRENRKRFIESEDFFHLTQSQMRSTDFVERENPQGMILLTESGYLMLVKSFNDDIAWQIQRQLVNNYFRIKKATKIHSDSILMRKLKLINSLGKGLTKAKQIELRRLAVIEAAEESGVDYSAFLAVLETSETLKEDLDQAVDLFLQEIRSSFIRYPQRENYLYLPPCEERRICERLKLDRITVLRGLEERGIIKISYEWNRGDRKKNYTAKSRFYNRRRCVQLKIDCINMRGE
ncbi:ORF6N domain-containing protein [Sporomusa aerivorans]|uniref:ORF6N domain-containing protein n=1 Tax=Sporomusa aerivorans TaxID=204936 RepID=UPI00352BA1E2